MVSMRPRGPSGRFRMAPCSATTNPRGTGRVHETPHAGGAARRRCAAAERLWFAPRRFDRAIADRGSGVGLAPDTAVATSPSTSSAGTVALLDAQSVAWFDALCSEIAPITAVQNIGDDPSGQDAATRWQSKLTALRTLSQAFSATSTRLAATEPPTFDGGPGFAEKLTTGLSDAASTLSAAADKLDAVDPTDATALAAAQPVFKINVLEAVSALQAVYQLDPSVVAAVRGIPSCQSLGA